MKNYTKIMDLKKSYCSQLISLTPFDLHKTLINYYVLTKRGSTELLKRNTANDKCDIDVIREKHQFLWDETTSPLSWEEKLAKKYYDKLFKEYCICDLTQFKENKVAMRWQTEQEMVKGKGQFICGDKNCNNKELSTWEVNFGYIEKGVKKNALVKLRLCSQCSYKLNYRHQKKEVRKRCNNSFKKQSNFDIKGKGKFKKEGNKPTECQEVAKDCERERNNIWRSNNTPLQEDKPRDEEFEEYLTMLLL
uniref:Protein FRA10AC1 homolog n=2 Tax=Clastoptera arizonana TaxID=38151 RepID=A0A1B6E3P6_9HEMI